MAKGNERSSISGHDTTGNTHQRATQKELKEKCSIQKGKKSRYSSGYIGRNFPTVVAGTGTGGYYRYIWQNGEPQKSVPSPKNEVPETTDSVSPYYITAVPPKRNSRFPFLFPPLLFFILRRSRKALSCSLLGEPLFLICCDSHHVPTQTCCCPERVVEENDERCRWEFHCY